MSELPVVVPAARSQPRDVPWPTREWPLGDSSLAIDQIVDEAFTLRDLDETHAVVVVRGGRVIAERYGGERRFFDRPSEAVTAATPLISWSMAKSMTHFLVGVLVDAGELDPNERAPVPEWSTPDDPRHAIKLRDLLAMRDGLDYVEDYVDGANSNVIEMLFGAGQGDTAGYTAARPLRHPPDTVFNYSSGTTNVISRIVADVVGYGDHYREFIQSRLFDPIGMSSAVPTFDDAGVFIGSSYVHATARDFAKFGLLYLRGGLWDGRQLLSRAWVDTAQVPLSVDEESGTFYSWQWWVAGDRFSTYWASGYEGQMIAVSPELDTVIVRLGRTPNEQYGELRAWRDRLLRALAR